MGHWSVVVVVVTVIVSRKVSTPITNFVTSCGFFLSTFVMVFTMYHGPILVLISLIVTSYKVSTTITDLAMSCGFLSINFRNGVYNVPIGYHLTSPKFWSVIVSHKVSTRITNFATSRGFFLSTFVMVFTMYPWAHLSFGQSSRNFT